MEEIWKDIPNFEGLYQASNWGRIKSLKKDVIKKNQGCHHYKERILKGWNHNTGYLAVTLNGKKYLVHRIVAMTFIENPNNYPIINHIDGNKKNNKIENLEWCTYEHNLHEAIKLGLIHIKYNSKENRIRAKKLNQYNLNGTLIKTYDCSTDAEAELKSKNIKVNAKNIRNVCNGIRKTAGGYIWRYANE